MPASEKLNDIGTEWTEVELALNGQGPAATRAQGELFVRYGGAMRRYLLAALHDQAAVDDLLQEFALAMVGGGFRNVQPERGRFRDYIKGVLFRLVQKHRRKVQRQPQRLSEQIDLTDPECFGNACDEQFRQSWRDELLARTWESLNHEDPTSFTVLHFRAAHPDVRSEQMAQQLSPQLGK